MISESVLWAVFGVIFVAVMAYDLGITDHGEHTVDSRNAVHNVIFYMAIACAFGALVFFGRGSGSAEEYFAVHAIEFAISVTNLFVFIIFSTFMIPEKDQHRMLFWGMFGCIVFRVAFIFMGAALLDTFEWMMYVFGAILFYIAWQTAFSKDGNKSTEEILSYRLSKRIRSTDDTRGGRFFVKENGRRMVTIMFLCLVVIDLSDIMFAFDSIPAALSITTDTFIVFTSNILAVLGLRSMYFVVERAIGSLAYLKYGLGVTLAFIGIKMTVSRWYEMDVAMSLLFILAVLAVTVLASMHAVRRNGGRGGVPCIGE